MSDKKLELESIWKYRLKLRAESFRVRDEGYRLWTDGEKLWSKDNRLWDEGDKMQTDGERLRIKGNKMQAESERLWHEAILDLYGDIKIEWKNFNEEKKDFECHLENGEIYGFND